MIFEKPVIEIIEFDAEDSIVCQSPGTGGGMSCVGSSSGCESFASVQEDS